MANLPKLYYFDFDFHNDTESVIKNFKIFEVTDETQQNIPATKRLTFFSEGFPKFAKIKQLFKDEKEINHFIHNINIALVKKLLENKDIDISRYGVNKILEFDDLYVRLTDRNPRTFLNYLYQLFLWKVDFIDIYYHYGRDTQKYYLCGAEFCFKHNYDLNRALENMLANIYINEQKKVLNYQMECEVILTDEVLNIWFEGNYIEYIDKLDKEPNHHF